MFNVKTFTAFAIARKRKLYSWLSNFRLPASAEHRQMETLLALREREFQALVEHSPDTISRFDRDCRCIYANPRMQADAGAPLEHLLYKTPEQFPGGEQAILYQDKIRQVFNSGEPGELELTWHSGDDRELCSHIRLTPEFDAEDRVVSVLAVGRDITEIDTYRKQIHTLAFFDTLTFLPNRALLSDRIRQISIDATRRGVQFGLMMLDLDRFKEVNDTLGHSVGDLLLREAAERLQTCVRGYDTVARLGGDEFAILLPEIRDGGDLGMVAGKIVNAINQPFLFSGRELFVSASVGITLFPDHSTDIDPLFSYADAAMYHAKKQKGNNFQFYSDELTSHLTDKMSTESALRKALVNAEMELYYQPQISLHSGEIIGAEALLRWNRGTLGMASPDQFIPVAEETGLIVEIGEWALASACRAASAWNRHREKPVRIAVNLSTRQFIMNDLLGTVRRVLDQTGCKTDWLKLEITESLLLEDSIDIAATLAAFSAMGLVISIDDFGTGYSALSYINRFPVQQIKIDKSFVQGIPEDHDKAELVKAMIYIAKSLRLDLVAEGVETSEQANYLLERGCATVQGYLFGKPMPQTEFERLLNGKPRSWLFERQSPKTGLSELEHRLLTRLTATLPGFIYTFRMLPDGHMSFPFASAGIWEMYGLQPEDVAEDATRLHAMAHPDDRLRIEAGLASSALEMSAFRCTFRIFNPTQGERWIEARSMPEREIGGSMLWHGVMLDVTEQKRLEQQLELKNFALDQAHDAIYLIDDKLRIVYVNEEACRALGYPGEELIGLTPPDIDPDTTREDALRLYEQMLANGHITFETRHRRRDGSLFPVEIQGSIFKYQDRVISMSLARDISERKRAEEALHFIAQRGWMDGAENFFDALVNYLGVTLGMDYVIIDRLDEDPRMAETVALYAKGAIVPNMRYLLKGTPCENVIGRNFCCYTQGVQQRFPEDTLLVDMGVESYVGIPLWDSSGQALGLIAVMDGKPLTDEAPVAQLLQLVAVRASAELERRRSDHVLREREREFRTLTENAPDNILRYDLNGRIIFANPGIEKTLGIATSTLIGKHTREVFPDGRFEEYVQTLERVLASGADDEIELVVPDDSAEEARIHHVRMVAERDESGELSGVLAIGRDITERKRIESVLALREHEFRSLAENLPDNIARWDTAGRYVYVNSIHERTLAATAADVIGKRLCEAFPDGRFTQVETAIAQVVATGQAMLFVRQPVPGENGETQIHDVNLVPERDADGQIIGVLGIGRDMTDRYRLQDDIAAREQEFRTLAENSPDPIYRYDRDCRRLYVNQAGRRMAASAEALIGNSPADGAILVSGQIGKLMDAIRRVFDSNEIVQIELDVVAAGGQRRDYQSLLVPERDDHGQVTTVLSLSRDITERKRMEDALQHIGESLAEAQRIGQMGSWELDLTSGALTWSDEVYRIFEIDPALFGASYEAFLDAIHPDDRAAVAKAYGESLENRTAYCIDHRLLFADARIKYVRECCETDYDEGGKPVRSRGTVQDVTERKRIETELRAQADFQQTLLNALYDVGIQLMMIENGRIIHIGNRKNALAFGFTDELLDSHPPLMNLVHPDDRPRVMDFHRRRQLGEDVPAIYELGLMRPDNGERREYETSVSVVPNTDPVRTVSIGRDITERKRMESELRNQANLHQTLLNAMNDVGLQLMMIENGRIVYVSNHELAHRFGFSDMVIAAQPAMLDIVHPEDQARVADYYLRRIRGEAVPNTYDLGLVTRSGERREYETAVAIVPGTDPPRIITVGKDVTDRKALELGRQAHLRFFESMDRINLAIQGADDLGRMMNDVLTEALAIFDCDRAYLLYPCDPDAPAWRVPKEVTRPEYPVALAEGASVPMDEEFGATLRILRDADGPVTFGPGTGHALPAEVCERFGTQSFMAMAVYPGTGKPWQFGMHQCSYARKWTQEEMHLIREIGRRLSDSLGSLLAYRELQAHEREFRSLAESSPGMMGSFYLRPDGSVCMPYASPNIWDLFGVHPQDVADDATPLLALNHPDDAQRVMESIAESARTMTPWRTEYRVLHPTRGERWMEGHTSPEPHPDGGIIWYGYVHDITERKQVEYAALESQEALYEAERIAEEQHYQAMLASRMEQSQKLEAVGTLAAGIAHDFNNLLGSMIGFAEMAGDELPEGSFGKSSIDQILTAGFRARDIVARMLTFARQNPAELVAVEVVSQITEALALLSVSLKPGVDIRFQAAIEQATVMADAGQVQQIVMNLCINAADAMNRKGVIDVRIDPVTLNDRTAGVAGDQAGVCLTVIDHGCGITPELQKRIFDPFFTTKAPNKGSGLGLSVIYGIVTQLGGVIEVQSRTEGDDHGAEFRVFLPLADNSC